MDNFIPYEKRSKKEKKKADSKKRSMWLIKPTNRIKQSAKVYNRKHQSKPNDYSDAFYFYISFPS